MEFCREFTILNKIHLNFKRLLESKHYGRYQRFTSNRFEKNE